MCFRFFKLSLNLWKLWVFCSWKICFLSLIFAWKSFLFVASHSPLFASGRDRRRHKQVKAGGCVFPSGVLWQLKINSVPSEQLYSSSRYISFFHLSCWANPPWSEILRFLCSHLSGIEPDRETASCGGKWLFDRQLGDAWVQLQRDHAGCEAACESWSMSSLELVFPRIQFSHTYPTTLNSFSLNYCHFN